MTLLPLLLACLPAPPDVLPPGETATDSASPSDSATPPTGPGSWTDPLQRGAELTLDADKPELVDVVWVGDRLLAAGQEQGGDGGLWAFDTTDPAAPALIDRTHVGHYQRLCWDGRWAWTTTRDGTVSRIAVTDDAVAIEQTWSRGSWTEGIACDGDRVAWGLGADGGEVATVSATGDLGEVQALSSEVRDALWLDGELWTLAYGALTRWDLDGDTPEIHATLGLTGTCLDLTADGGRIAVACGSAGVHLVDPAGPTLLGTWAGHVSARAVALAGDRAAVAGWTEALVLDVSDPASPTLLASESASHAAMAVALSGDHLAVADWRQGWVAERFNADAPEVRPRDAWATPGERLTLTNDGTAPLWLGVPDAGTLDATSLAPGESAAWQVPDDATDTISVATDDPDELTLAVPVGGVDGLSVGDPAPLFLEPDLGGTGWSLEALRGEVVFLGLFNEG